MARLTAMLCALGALAVMSASTTMAAAPATHNKPTASKAMVLQEPLAAHFNMSGIVGVLSFEAEENPTSHMDYLRIRLEGFTAPPKSAYAYHVHEFSVGPNRNCSATGAHLDPAKVGVAVKCNPAEPQTCQAGDLSGKHGLLQIDAEGQAADLNYQDRFLTMDNGDSSIVGRSVVLHDATTGAKVACADILNADQYKADEAARLANPQATATAAPPGLAGDGSIYSSTNGGQKSSAASDRSMVGAGVVSMTIAALAISMML